MEIYENKSFTYIFSADEKEKFDHILTMTYQYLVKSGFKTFDLNSEDMEFLETYCNSLVKSEMKNEKKESI